MGVIMVIFLSWSTSVVPIDGGTTNNNENGVGCVDEVNGVEYAIGDLFASSDGCNTCVCGRNGKYACTRMVCPRKKKTGNKNGVGCLENGKEYAIGTTFASSDGCNTCACGSNGLRCTRMVCPP